MKGDYRRGRTSRRGAKMTNVKEENFRNVNGRGGIELFISNELWHLKRHDQPKGDMWHTP